MTLPNDPFDFLWRSDEAAPTRDGADPVSGSGSGSAFNSAFSGGSGARAGQPERFEPDLDAFFDDDLSADESELLYEHIRRERALAAEMFGTQRALEALRSTPHCPDLSQRILKQVDRKRGLLSGPWLRRVVVGRVAIAATLLLAMGGLYALHRASPELATLGQPTPIGQLASAVPADASRSRRAAEAGLEPGSEIGLEIGGSGWASGLDMAGLDIQGAAMDSRAALHARSVMRAGVEARRVMVDAGETLPLGGDGVVFADPSALVSVAGSGEVSAAGTIVRPASQIAVEFPGLQGVAVVHDPSHERAFQAMLAAQPVATDLASDHADAAAASRRDHVLASRQAGSGRPAQPIVTDDCVYYMGRVIDRHAFQTVLLGFTAMAPLSLD